MVRFRAGYALIMVQVRVWVGVRLRPYQRMEYEWEPLGSRHNDSDGGDYLGKEGFFLQNDAEASRTRSEERAGNRGRLMESDILGDSSRICLPECCLRGNALGER